MTCPVVEYIKQRWDDNPEVRDVLLEQWAIFDGLGLADATFVDAFVGGDKAQFHQRLWEMYLGVHLRKCGFEVQSGTAKKHGGPDFVFEHEGKKTWVEAICPKPKGIPEEFFRTPEAGEFLITEYPHNEILLRWTNGIDAKKQKFEKYLTKGIVDPADCQVVAISGSMLSDGASYSNYGISQYPFVLEAVYPIGARELNYSKEAGKHVASSHSYRASIKKSTGTKIDTDLFFQDSCRHISAVFGSNKGIDEACGEKMFSVLVHNHRATNPLPLGIMGVDEEYWVEDQGAEFVLHKIEHSNTGDTMSIEKDEDKIDWKPVYKIGGLIIFLWLWTFSSFVLFDDLNWFDVGNRGSFGDMFGGLNALFSGAAFTGIIFTILLQRKELFLQREELKLTRQELQGQKQEMAVQNETLKLQQFENTFFSMLRTFSDIVNSLDIIAKDGKVTKGRDCTKVFLDRLLDYVQGKKAKWNEYKQGTGNFETDYEDWWLVHRTELGHYFRMMYNIIQFINKAQTNGLISNGRKYSRILRAQLSDQEQAILFYNCVSNVGKGFLKDVKRHKLVKHVPDDFLLDPRHKLEYYPSIFKEIKNGQ